jgi:hypothetical protein
MASRNNNHGMAQGWGMGGGSEKGNRGHAPRGRGRGRGGGGGNVSWRSAPYQPRSPLPRNACRFFWETGHCLFELDCK